MAITFRNIKDAALTHIEMDTNLSSYYLSSSVSGSTITFFQSSSVDGTLISSSHDLADSDAQTLTIAGDQLSISNGNTVTVPTGSDTTYTAGNDLELIGTTFNNTAPDQTVSITGQGSTTVTGTYPDFIISSSDNDTTYSNLSEFTNDVGYITSSTDTTYTAGTGLTLTGTEFSLTEAHFSGDYDDLINKPTVGLSLVTNNLTLTKLDGTTDIVDLTPYLDEDARAIASGTLDSVTGIVTFTRDDATTFTLDLSDLLDDTNLVTSVNGSAGVVEIPLQSVCDIDSTTTTTITAANFITTSDKRLKSDIKPIQEGLETIKKFVSYEYVKDGVQDAGFLAQEVQEAIPYSIGEREDGFLTMRDRPVLAHMHKAILELEARLAAIEEKLQ